MNRKKKCLLDRFETVYSVPTLKRDMSHVIEKKSAIQCLTVYSFTIKMFLYYLVYPYYTLRK